jgi:hypothetical protein
VRRPKRDRGAFRFRYTSCFNTTNICSILIEYKQVQSATLVQRTGLSFSADSVPQLSRFINQWEVLTMTSKYLRSSLTLAAFLSLGIFAFAQHGRAGGSGMGGGPPAGAGSGMGAGAGPGMGAGAGMGNGAGSGAGMGAGNYGRPSGAGSGMGHGSTSGSSMGSQAPDKALSNSRLDSSLTSALGKSGIDVPGGNLQSACQGFRNLGSCIAALHVSKNLGISFDQLRSTMTGPDAQSLGKAIQSLGGPNVTSKSQAKSEAKHAGKQAKQDLKAAASDAAEMAS